MAGASQGMSGVISQTEPKIHRDCGGMNSMQLAEAQHHSKNVEECSLRLCQWWALACYMSCYELANFPSHCKLIPYPCDTSIPPDKTLGIIALLLQAAYNLEVGQPMFFTWLEPSWAYTWWKNGGDVIHCMLWATKANQVWSSIRQRVRSKMADRLRIDTQSFQWFPHSGNLDPTIYIYIL